ncbi:hypothetical protein I5F18_21290 [Bacillus halotolerans]|uniref:hypothetical protein n=1 Tax=Bacillus halotolerans TaxID=260554 RepID=UPI00192CBF35|nr:hypothetical protein [Bacillus halotolerans]MBL4974824.1 hypothetical protein [Bacillus halotolerans]
MSNGVWYKVGPIYLNEYPINAGQHLSIPVISAPIEGNENNPSRVVDVLWEAKKIDGSEIIPVSLVLKKVFKDSQQDIHEKMKVHFYNNSDYEGKITVHFIFEWFLPYQQ